jgi:hypothetical protein
MSCFVKICHESDYQGHEKRLIDWISKIYVKNTQNFPLLFLFFLKNLDNINFSM